MFEISATTNPQHSLSIRVGTGLLQLMPGDKHCDAVSEEEKIQRIEAREPRRNMSSWVQAEKDPEFDKGDCACAGEIIEKEK